ncbi:MAG: DUF805 domain-containing protein [bacterium]|nr:DUF805 domain-containing protein [bacterium]
MTNTAIKARECTDFFNCSGRSTRGEFWRISLLSIVIYIMGGLLSFGIVVAVDPWLGMALSIMVHTLAFLLPLPTTVRRYHDLDMSGTWYLFFACFSVFVVPALLNFILLGFLPGTRGPNRYGPPPTDVAPIVVKKIQASSSSSPQLFKLRLERIEKMYAKKMISKQKYEQQKAALLAKIEASSHQQKEGVSTTSKAKDAALETPQADVKTVSQSDSETP